MAMIVIPRRVPWQRQPTGKIRVSRSHPHAQGLVAAWPMGNSVVQDVASFRHHATRNGNPKLQSTSIGKALLFNGTSDYLTVPHHADLSPTNKSVFALINRSAIQNNAQIIKKNNDYILRIDDPSGTPNVKWFVRTNSTWRGLTLTENIGNGAWHTIIGSWDGTTMLLFVDGVLRTSSTPGGTTTTGTESIGIAADPAGTERYSGFIGDLRFYDRPTNEDLARDMHLFPWAVYQPRTQRIFLPVGGTKTATFVLNDKDSAAVANATGIRAAWFDQMPGSSMAAPTDVSAIETSDGSGNHTINIPNSTLTSGQTGYYAISNSDGTIATNHLQGGGPAKVD